MNYEKAYKEALERAKIWQKHLYEVDDKDYADELNYIFPELKESENEKIRKELITHCRNIRCVTEEGAERIAKWIAWLEKQGEKKLINDTEEEIVKAMQNTSILDIIEPKFKVDDWISNGRYTKLIVGINSDWPHYMFNDGISKRIKDIDENYHLWTSEDAKDGDVLVSQYNKPFIYNGNYDPFHIGSYCGISVEDRFNVATEKCLWTENVNIHPATKEQRDLLFQKIKEAGYKWDSEKKELEIINWSKHIKYEPNGPSIVKENNEWSEGNEKMLNSVETDYLQEFHENLKKLKGK